MTLTLCPRGRLLVTGLLLLLAACMATSVVTIAETIVGDQCAVIGPDQTVTKDGLLYEVDKALPFTGKTVIQYSDGQKAQEFTYKDGKQHGKVTAWYENGQLKAEISFKDGKPYGPVTSWHKNGETHSKDTFKNGKLVGKTTRWYENGQKSAEANYQDGKLDGMQTTWHENGQKKREATYKDGGIFTETNWDKNGKEIPATNKYPGQKVT